MIRVNSKTAKAKLLIIWRDLIKVGNPTNEGVNCLYPCVVDGDFSQQFGEWYLDDEALEVLASGTVDEDGRILANWSPLLYHIRYAQMKTAILPHYYK